MTSTTPHYSFILPDNFGSQNVWGGILNGDFGSIDTAIWNASLGTTIGINTPASSAINLTLTNPLNNIQQISFSTTGKDLILPVMNSGSSLVVGGAVKIINVGSNPFAIFAQDTVTSIVASVIPGQTINLTLISSSTANGSFLVSSPLLAANNLSELSVPNTALNNILPSQTSNGGKVLTTNGTTTSWQPVEVMPGSMLIWTTNTAPTGYLECDGSPVSRTTYASLFAIIGTSWGSGDGTTTFNIPDMRGYFPRGWAHASSIDSGRAFASTQADSFASHTHAASVTDSGHTHSNTITDTGHTHSVPSGDGMVVNVSQSGGAVAAATFIQTTGSSTTGINVTVASATTGISVSNSNTGGTETRPINVAIMFIIKT